MAQTQAFRRPRLSWDLISIERKISLLFKAVNKSPDCINGIKKREELSVECKSSNPGRRLPEFQRGAGPPPSQRCGSGGYSWGTGRRSCSPPDQEPAGTRSLRGFCCLLHSRRSETERRVTGTFTFLNISAPLRASSRAMSCGVDTMTAPARRHHTAEWIQTASSQ